MRRSLLFGLLMLFFPAFLGAQEKEPLPRVKSLIESCQFSQAISLAELFLSADSSRSDLLLMKGRALAAIFQYREAVVALQQAALLDSMNVKVLNELADAYRQSGDPARAILTIKRMIRLEPENRFFQLQLANLYYSEEDYRLSADMLLTLYKTDSSSFFVAKQLGNCFNELKRSDSAIRFYRRALRITPFDAYITGKLVNLFIREDNVAMALYWTQLYLSQDSSYLPILKQNGYCFYLLIDFKSSAAQLRKCTMLGDSSKFTMKYLGLSYYKQEKYDSAAPFFRCAFNADTTDAEVCFYCGVSAYRSLAVDTGLVYLKRTLRLLMPSGKFLSTLYSELADANTSKGNADTAVIFLKKALEANPENNTLRFKIAYEFDFHLRQPYEGLPYYRDFLKNLSAEKEVTLNLPQMVSYSDYAKNRIREIAGVKKK
ncbi:MAG: tetratricopeptide repeat protein [Bacteroidales bacterium]